jgi:hypothetical protein
MRFLFCSISFKKCDPQTMRDRFLQAATVVIWLGLIWVVAQSDDWRHLTRADYFVMLWGLVGLVALMWTRFLFLAASVAALISVAGLFFHVVELGSWLVAAIFMFGVAICIRVWG